MSTISIGVRRARLQDAPAISAVHDAAWRYAYRGILPAVELERMVERRGAQWWQRAIRRHVIVLVLEVGGRAVGYATMGPNRMRRSSAYGGEIYEIYLLPEVHGLGFGRRLFEESRRVLAQQLFRGLVVRAVGENTLATGFYRRLGGCVVVETAERIGDSVLAVTVFGWEAA